MLDQLLLRGQLCYLLLLCRVASWSDDGMHASSDCGLDVAIEDRELLLELRGDSLHLLSK